MRLGRSNEISSFLSLRQSIPDVGQGALLIQCRNDDILPIVNSCLDDKTQLEVTTERAFVSAIGGSCTSPVAAYAETFGSEITVRTMAGLPDGTEMYTSEITQSLSNLDQIGEMAAVALFEAGAASLIGEING
jgi:hydroxymethylbilane synthase